MVNRMKSKAKAKAGAAPPVSANDATPERIAQGSSTMVDPRWSPDETRTTLKVRQFRTTRLDHLYHLGSLTWAQWYAGNWWRTQAENALGLPRVVADYGQSNGGGSGDPSPIPITPRAEAARMARTAAIAALTVRHRMAVEDALDDPHEQLFGSAASARVAQWREALQALAVYLKVATAASAPD